MNNIKYEREKACAYAKKWAYLRNPKYYDFDKIGGDCTNFVSQCIFAGSNVMNYTKDVGWYYLNANNKSPSWTGVEFLYQFLIKNKSVGPFGKDIQFKNIEKGDIIQLSFDGNKFEHSLIVIDIGNNKNLEEIKIAAHTWDSLNKPIIQYQYNKIRFIHIEGVNVV